MGVSIEQWCRTVSAHPRSFRYDGLGDPRGRQFFKTPQEAALRTERFIENRVEAESKYYSDQLEAAIDGTKPFDNFDQLLRYKEWLVDRIGGQELIDNADKFAVLFEKCEGDAYNPWLRRCIAVVEGFLGGKPRHHRDAWLEDRPDFDYESIASTIRSMDAASILKDHPPVEVLNHASGSGIDVDKVFYFCPSCGQEPTEEGDVITETTVDSCKGRFYCGLCGAESCVDDFSTFLVDVVLPSNLYPFNKKLRVEWRLRLRRWAQARAAITL